jgi:hypothetical protein
LNDASIFGYETVWAETEMEIASATHTPVTLEMALREFLNLENIEHRTSKQTRTGAAIRCGEFHSAR